MNANFIFNLETSFMMKKKGNKINRAKSKKSGIKQNGVVLVLMFPTKSQIVTRKLLKFDLNCHI